MRKKNMKKVGKVVKKRSKTTSLSCSKTPGLTSTLRGVLTKRATVDGNQYIDETLTDDLKNIVDRVLQGELISLEVA